MHSKLVVGSKWRPLGFTKGLLVYEFVSTTYDGYLMKCVGSSHNGHIMVSHAHLEGMVPYLDFNEELELL